MKGEPEVLPLSRQSIQLIGWNVHALSSELTAVCMMGLLAAVSQSAHSLQVEQILTDRWPS